MINDTLIIKSDYNSLEEEQVFVNYFTIEGVILKKDLAVCKVLYNFFLMNAILIYIKMLSSKDVN